MSSLIHPDLSSKLFTCRYWKYGRRGCPYKDTECRFAHSNTGILSNISSQKGTCRFWKYSPKGCNKSDCLFEHCETGVENFRVEALGPALQKNYAIMQKLQNTKKLIGVDADIARAVRHAGFDCGNREALLELIFAVRRAGGHRVADTYPARYSAVKCRKGDFYRPQYPPDWEAKRKRGGVQDGLADDSSEDSEMEYEWSSAKRPRTSARTNRDLITDNEDPNGWRPMQLNLPYHPLPSTSSAPKKLQAKPIDPTYSELRKIMNTLRDNSAATAQALDALSKLWLNDQRMRGLHVVPHLEDLKRNLDMSVFSDARSTQNIEYALTEMGIGPIGAKLGQ